MISGNTNGNSVLFRGANLRGTGAEARVRNNRGDLGAVRSDVLNVANQARTLASLIGTPKPDVKLGKTLKLTIGGAADANKRVDRVECSSDTNGDGAVGATGAVAHGVPAARLLCSCPSIRSPSKAWASFPVPPARPRS